MRASENQSKSRECLSHLPHRKDIWSVKMLTSCLSPAPYPRQRIAAATRNYQDACGAPPLVGAAPFFPVPRGIVQMRIWRKRVGVEFTPCQNRKELREDATSPKQREGIHRSAYCPRIAHEFPSRAFPLRQHHLHHPAIRFPQCFWNRLCIDVQGCPNISVTE